MASKKTEQTEVTDLSDIQKQIAAILEEAKAEAARIVKEAKAGMNLPSDDSEKAARKAESIARGEEPVEVKLFKDNAKYKDDVFVGVNGETIGIKRGERVVIKRKFAEVLENSTRQDYETSMLIEAQADQFVKDSKKFL